jgi:phosphohistidine phosphatase
MAPSRARPAQGQKRGAVANPVSFVVLRHGPTEVRDPVRWPDDDDRPLSSEGESATKQAVRGLVSLHEPFGPILTSPARRARHTADLLRKALPGTVPIEVWEELAPGAPAEPILARIASRRFPRIPVLVGHEPTLGELVGESLSGESVSWVRLTRAGAAQVSFSARATPGGASLDWLLTRDQLRRL